MQILTDLTDYPNDGITVDQLLLDKMVTSLNDTHPRQKLYKEGKDLTMEKTLSIIWIYVAKHEAQGTTVNYLKGKDMGPCQGKAQPNNNNSNNKKQDSQRSKPQNQDNKDKCGKCRKGTY